MEKLRKLNSRELQVMAGAVYEWIDDRFPRHGRAAKRRLATSIADDIKNNFDFNTGLDAIRSMGATSKATKALEKKLQSAWKNNES